LSSLSGKTPKPDIIDEIFAFKRHLQAQSAIQRAVIKNLQLLILMRVAQLVLIGTMWMTWIVLG